MSTARSRSWTAATGRCLPAGRHQTTAPNAMSDLLPRRGASHGEPDTRAGAPWAYDAFISYETTSSKASAERIDRGLRAIARRHEKGANFRVFRDRTTLRAGPLEQDLIDKLKRSRCLIVVLHSA